MSVLQIGQQLQISYAFIKPGSVVTTEGDMFCYREGNELHRFPKNSTIFLDIGNSLEPGIIDHHSLFNGIQTKDGQRQSATGLVTIFKDYLTAHLDANASEITIFIHSYPDIDCLASAFLAETFLKTGRFPEKYEALVDYVEEIDQGLASVTQDNVGAPFTIVYAIDQVVDKMLESDPAFGLLPVGEQDKKKNERYFERGFQLIQLIMDFLQLEDDIELVLNSPYVLMKTGRFQEEFQLIKDDYQKYINDKQQAGKVKKLKLPLKDLNKKGTQVVEGIFFNRAPECILHKYWARFDSTSENGEGYIFTFIPIYKQKYSEELQTEFSQAIISVKPDSLVSLKGLGQMLEHEEFLKEKKWSEDHPSYIKRDQISNRPGYNIGDPWYDGRNHQFTIVDSPRRGSLLTIEEMEQIVNKYTEPMISTATVKHVYPFTFVPQVGIFGRIDKNLRNLPSDWKVLSSNETIGEGNSEFFLKHIEKYLSANDSSTVQSQSCHYTFDNPTKFTSIQNYLYDLTMVKQVQNELTKKDFFELRKMNLHLFKYGVGFLVLEVNIESELYVENLLSFNRILSGKSNDELRRTIFNICFGEDFLNNNKPFRKCEIDSNFDGLVYAAIKLDEKTYNMKDQEEILYKLSNLKNFTDPFYGIDAGSSLALDQNSMLGFGKSGGGLIIKNEGSQGNHSEPRDLQRIDHLWSEFHSRHFYTFLISLHQRLILINFSQLLSKYNSEKKYSGISRLRFNIMDFTAQIWSSQISNHELGINIYKRWNVMFENETFYREVFEQLSAIDEHYKAQSSNKFNKVTMIVFPLVLISTIVQAGLVKIEAITDFSFKYGMISTIIAYILCILIWNGSVISKLKLSNILKLFKKLKRRLLK